MRYRSPCPSPILADEDIHRDILKATVRKDYFSPVVSCYTATEPILIGLVVLFPGQQYYLVKDRDYPNRFYAFTRNLRTGKWRCSYAGVAQYCFLQVKAYRQEQWVLRRMGQTRLVVA